LRLMIGAVGSRCLSPTESPLLSVMIALIDNLMSPHSDVRPFDTFGAGANGSTYAVPMPNGTEY
jgi:hypothetical protein